MPKKVKDMEIIRDEVPEPVKPVTVKTELSGPKLAWGQTPACSLKLPSEILDASGFRACDRVELTAGDGAIIITKIGDPRPGLPNLPPRDALTRALMSMTRDYENREREAWKRNRATDEGLRGYIFDGETEDEDGALKETEKLDSEPL